MAAAVACTAVLVVVPVVAFTEARVAGRAVDFMAADPDLAALVSTVVRGLAVDGPAVALVVRAFMVAPAAASGVAFTAGPAGAAGRVAFTVAAAGGVVAGGEAPAGEAGVTPVTAGAIRAMAGDMVCGAAPTGVAAGAGARLLRSGPWLVWL